MIWKRKKIAPRVTITLHESIGPAAVAAVLHHAGLSLPVRRSRWFWRRLWDPRWCQARIVGKEWRGQCKWRRGHPYPHTNWSGDEWTTP